jgi:hypothetical protein
MKLTNIRTKEIIEDFKSTPSNYLVKCDDAKYATHTDDAGNYYCMYGVYAAFDGKDIIVLNNK